MTLTKERLRGMIRAEAGQVEHARKPSEHLEAFRLALANLDTQEWLLSRRRYKGAAVDDSLPMPKYL